jgi:ankyrin repeat protein
MTMEDLVEMMAVLDADGDDEVTKDEFKEWYQANMTTPTGDKVSDDEFEVLWGKIDEDGDGHLQQSELCSYFGVSFDEASGELEKKKGMSDEEILQALQLQTQLHEAKERALAAEAEKKKKSLTKRTASGARAGIKIIKKDETGDEQDLLEACDCIERADIDMVKQLLDKGVNTRIETQDKAEMPLHKLARNGQHALIRQIVDGVKAANGQDAAVADVNSQDKRGHTPLFTAVEGRQDLLNQIESQPDKLLAYREKQARTALVLLNSGADLYVEASNGWNALHAAAHGGAFEAAKEIFSYMEKTSFSKQQTRRFLNHLDTMGRSPLHIAAMRSDPESDKPELVNLMMMKGADPNITDKGSGMTASQLAEKAGRRKSKEFIDEMKSSRASQEQAYRRKSRSRDDIPDMPDGK